MSKKAKIDNAIFINFLPLALMVTLLCGLFYLVVQQTIRLSANDIPLQIAKDLANNLALQKNIPSNFPPTKVDISKSLSPFIMVFDKNKKLIGSTAVVNNKTVLPPTGVLDTAKAKGRDMVTWQTDTGQRSAIVALYFKGNSEGYVVAGRSLYYTEKLEELIGRDVMLGWIATIVLVFLAKFFVFNLRAK